MINNYAFFYYPSGTFCCVPAENEYEAWQKAIAEYGEEKIGCVEGGFNGWMPTHVANKPKT